MSILDTFITEESTNELANKVAEKTKNILSESLISDFYDQINYYIYQHYDNFKTRIEKELIAELCDKYIDDPASYKYVNLRRAIYRDNKDAIQESLTDQMMEDKLFSVLTNLSRPEQIFSWAITEGLAKYIIDNWDKLQKIRRIESKFISKIKALENTVIRLTKENCELQNSKDKW